MAPMPPKILIVDDDEIARQVSAALLAECGAELLEARDGHEALTLARDHDCCLVLLDIQMPGMNGYRVAEALRHDQRTAHLPIVFVTGMLYHDEPLSLEQQLGHADLMLEKPVNPDMLRQVVRLVLRMRQREVPSLAPAAQQELERLRKENLELRMMQAGRVLRGDGS